MYLCVRPASSLGMPWSLSRVGWLNSRHDWNTGALYTHARARTGVPAHVRADRHADRQAFVFQSAAIFIEHELKSNLFFFEFRMSDRHRLIYSRQLEANIYSGSICWQSEDRGWDWGLSFRTDRIRSRGLRFRLVWHCRTLSWKTNTFPFNNITIVWSVCLSVVVITAKW